VVSGGCCCGEWDSKFLTLFDTPQWYLHGKGMAINFGFKGIPLFDGRTKTKHDYKIESQARKEIPAPIN
jgi:hypothetical protein